MMHNNLEQYMQEFLRGEGNNVPLADGLLLLKRFYIGPLEFPVDKLERCCGPEENMKYKTSEENFNKRINRIIQRLESGWELPPLLVNYEREKYTINDGNHRLEAYRRLNKATIPVIIWITEETDYQLFVESVLNKS